MAEPHGEPNHAPEATSLNLGHRAGLMIHQVHLQDRHPVPSQQTVVNSLQILLDTAGGSIAINVSVTQQRNALERILHGIIRSGMGCGIGLQFQRSFTGLSFSSASSLPR